MRPEPTGDWETLVGADVDVDVDDDDDDDDAVG